MAKFILAYRGGVQPKLPEEGLAHMQKFQGWVVDLGKAMVEAAVPLESSTTVTADGAQVYQGSDSWSGYSIVQAENLEEAIGFAKDCPHREIGGKIEVAQLMEVKVPEK